MTTQKSTASIDGKHVVVGQPVRFYTGVELPGKLVKISRGNKVVVQLTDALSGEAYNVTCTTEHCHIDNPAQLTHTFDGVPNCAQMRESAREWVGSRKEFVEHMASLGANPATATTQWGKGRSH